MMSNKPRPHTSLQKLSNQPSTRKIKTAKPVFPVIPKSDENDLDLMYLLIKKDPEKYDLERLNEKFKTVNSFYSNKLIHKQMNRVDSTFYKYNILYGTNSNNIIKSYSQKLRPDSAGIRNINIYKLNISDADCFTEEDIKILFIAKCADLNIKTRPNLEKNFIEYCNKKCINREVDFNDCSIGINTSKILGYILKTNDNISRLYLSKNNIGDKGIEILMNGIKFNKSLVHLDISSNDLTYKGGDYVIDGLITNESIISLDIGSREGVNRNRLTSEGIKKIETLLKNNKFLQSLNISGNSLKNEGLHLIIKGLNNNKTLEYLDISNNEIDHKGLVKLSKVQSCKLTSLIMNDNQLGNEGISFLAEQINKFTFSSLRQLEIVNCKFDFFGVCRLFDLLQGNKRVEVLDISKNNLKSTSEDESKFKSAFNNLYLKELKINNCKLGNISFRVISEFLLSNSSISKLFLSDNSIDDKGFIFFEDVPLKNYTLQVIDLSKNQISDFSANPFMKNLIKNTSLKEINLYDNQIKNETGSTLIEVLRSNSNLQKVNLKFNGIQIRSLDEIERLIKSNENFSKLKKIPNLRKEIRSTYVTDLDFENVDMRIKESAMVYQTLSDKLSEEVERFEKMKNDEERKINLLNNQNNDIIQSNLSKEEEIKHIKKEILIENEYFNKISDKENKEISNLNDEIEEYENKIREYKKEVDKKGLLWKEDIKKISSEYLNSITSLKSSIKGYESLKKDLDAKIEIIRLLEKNEEADKENIDKEKSEKESFTITNSPKKGKAFPKRASLKSINENEDKEKNENNKNNDKDGGVSIKKGKTRKSPKKSNMAKGKVKKKLEFENDNENESETVTIKQSMNNFDLESNSKSKKKSNLKRPNI